MTSMLPNNSLKLTRRAGPYVPLAQPAGEKAVVNVSLVRRGERRAALHSPQQHESVVEDRYA